MQYVVIVLNDKIDVPKVDADYVGVESGALKLLKENLPIKFAIGDFDSIQKEDADLIKDYADDFIELPNEKDCTDSEAAIRECIKRGYEKIFILGGLGNRVDHEIVNLRLIMEYPQDIILHNETNRILSLSEGEYQIEKDDYPYISFFAKDEAIISLDGFKYPLQQKTITKDDLYTVSNEILNENGKILIEKGIVLVIQSKD